MFRSALVVSKASKRQDKPKICVEGEMNAPKPEQFELLLERYNAKLVEFEPTEVTGFQFNLKIIKHAHAKVERSRHRKILVTHGNAEDDWVSKSVIHEAMLSRMD
jgi:hypothetical protein